MTHSIRRHIDELRKCFEKLLGVFSAPREDKKLEISHFRLSFLFFRQNIGI